MVRHENCSNVRVVGAQGTSDDLDVPIEAMFRDSAFKQATGLSSMNSVNIVRLLSQIVHFFWSYLQLEPQAAKPVAFSVPTGAAGHISAAILAAKMGLPVACLCASVNDNDILHRFLKSGALVRSTLTHTNSPAMDIQAPYNVERMLYIATDPEDGSKVADWMTGYNTGNLHVSPDVLDPLRALGLCSTTVSSSDVLSTINKVYNSNKVCIVYFHDGV